MSDRPVTPPVRAGDAVRASREGCRETVRDGAAVVTGLWAVTFVALIVWSDAAMSVGADFSWRVVGSTFVFAWPGLLCAALTRRARWWAVWAATFAAMVLVLALPWHPRKRIIRDLHALRRGMTFAEVEAAMDEWRRGQADEWEVRAVDWPTGATRDTFNGSITYIWTDRESDRADVLFEDGRVVGTRWSND